MFSMMGTIVRIAERMGLQRDGGMLGLSPMKAEERRRVWWQMQHLEILISSTCGCFSMTVTANWDTKLPSNLEDDDIHPELERLPLDRPGLTEISHCLWWYNVFDLQRPPRKGEEESPRLEWLWTLSPRLSVAEKDAVTEQFRKIMVEKFLQHCELLNPLHVLIQIGIQSFVLGCRMVSRQPKVFAKQITESPLTIRDEMLQICVKSMEYYILSETTPSIAHLKWHNEDYFNWKSCMADPTFP